jgi:hypothetical protein
MCPQCYSLLNPVSPKSTLPCHVDIRERIRAIKVQLSKQADCKVTVWSLRIFPSNYGRIKSRNEVQLRASTCAGRVRLTRGIVACPREMQPEYRLALDLDGKQCRDGVFRLDLTRDGCHRCGGNRGITSGGCWRNAYPDSTTSTSVLLFPLIAFSLSIGRRGHS